MKYLLFVIVSFLCIAATAQNVGVGTSSPSAKLDISSTNSGVLIPRLALTATNTASPVTSPVASMLIYNTASAGSGATAVTPGYYYWDGTALAWVRLIDNVAASNNIYNTDGTLTGARTLTDGANNLTITSTTGNLNFTTTSGVNHTGGGNMAMGNTVTASGGTSVAFGTSNTASGVASLVAGWQNNATGPLSVAFGQQNTASGYASFVTNIANTASASYTSAFGKSNTASGDISLAAGYNNHALSYAEMAVGINGTSYTPSSISSYSATDRIFDIGNGASSASPSDALTVLKNGNVGIGNASPAQTLDVNGTTKTTNLQMTNGASAGYIMKSDGSGNASWVNPNTITTATAVSNTSSANTLTTTVNGVTGAGVNLINSNALSLSGTSITSTVNGQGSNALDISSIDKNIYNADGSLTGPRTVTMAANNLTFGSTSGNLIFSPSSTGQVGIGTSSPGATVDVENNANSTFNTLGHFLAPNNTTSGDVAQLRLGVATTNYNSAEIRYVYNGAGSTSSVAQLGLYGQTGISVNGLGYLGVGTAAPTTAKIVVAGTAGTQGLDLSTSDQYANMRVLQNTNNASDKDMYIGYNSGTTSSLHLYSNNGETETVKGGNVGIGATAPAVLLAVGGNGSNIYNTSLWTENNIHVQGNETLTQGGRGRLRVGTAWNYPGLYSEASSTGVSTDLVLGSSSALVRVGPDGGGQNLKVSGLEGTGNRPVYANSNGQLKVANGDNSVWVMSLNMASSEDDLVGTVLSADNDDNVTYQVTLPFTVTIEGVGYPYLAVCTNGWASFETSLNQVTTTTATETALPTSSFSTPTVFAYWDDLKDYGSGEAVRSQTFGTTPNRTHVIDWKMRALSGTTYNVYFQMEIHEGNNMINVKYHTMNAAYCGQSATIGFQLAGGASAKAFPITFDGKVLDDNAGNAEGWSVCPLR